MFQNNVCLSDETVHPWGKPSTTVFRIQGPVLDGKWQLAPNKFTPPLFPESHFWFSGETSWVDQSVCLLALLLVKMSFQAAFWRLSVGWFMDDGKGMFCFSSGSWEFVKSCWGCYSNRYLLHCSEILCYVHCYGLFDCNVVPHLSGETEPRTGLWATPKEASPYPASLE